MIKKVSKKVSLGRVLADGMVVMAALMILWIGASFLDVNSKNLGNEGSMNELANWNAFELMINLD